MARSADFGKRLSERLLSPGTCRNANSHKSAFAVVGRLPLEGQQQYVLRPLINTPIINSGWQIRAAAYRKSLLTLLLVTDLRAVAVWKAGNKVKRTLLKSRNAIIQQYGEDEAALTSPWQRLKLSPADLSSDLSSRLPLTEHYHEREDQSPSPCRNHRCRPDGLREGSTATAAGPSSAGACARSRCSYRGGTRCLSYGCFAYTCSSR